MALTSNVPPFLYNGPTSCVFVELRAASNFRALSLTPWRATRDRAAGPAPRRELETGTEEETPTSTCYQVCAEPLAPSDGGGIPSLIGRRDSIPQGPGRAGRRQGGCAGRSGREGSPLGLALRVFELGSWVCASRSLLGCGWRILGVQGIVRKELWLAGPDVPLEGFPSRDRPSLSRQTMMITNSIRQ
jgi:hypothetical protein